MRQLRAADLFAGGGGFTTGAEQAGLKVIMALNHSDFALKTHTINHPEVAHSRMTTFMSDWQYYKDHMPDIDVLMASPACVPSSALIEMSDGRQIRVDELKIGDVVLTHMDRGRKVTNIWTKRFSGSMVSLRLWGDSKHELRMTDDHLVWVRRRVWDNNKRTYVLGDPAFVRADEIGSGDYVAFPRARQKVGTAKRFVNSLRPKRVKYAMLACAVAGADRASYKHDAYKNEMPGAKIFFDGDDEDLWWLIGNYLGDGEARGDGRPEIGWSVGGSTETLCRIERILSSHGLSPWMRGDEGNRRIFTSSTHLHAICTAFGRLAHIKMIPPELLRLEPRYIEALILGYLDGDGSSRVIHNNDVWRSTSTSLPLLQGIQRLCWSLGWSACIAIGDYAREAVILGRTVQCKDSWEISIRKKPHKQSRTKFDLDDTHVWRSVHAVTRKKVTRQKVYDIEVAEDHTFCLPGLVVHNCQGHSTAATKGGTGKRGTADDHELLRSTAHTITAALDGLAYRRALPKLVVVENVPEFRLWSFDPDKKDGSAYRHWVENFTGRGYDVSEFIVNAADTGEVPQDRKRMFVVATHKKKAPRIPQPHREHLAFGDSVDLSSGDWRPVSEATENTRARAERGRKKFPDDKAFLINLGDSQHSGRSLKRPIGTITTKVHWYLVKRDSRGRDLVRGLTVDEHRKAMAFPESYELPATPSQAVPLLGNAVCPPVARYVLEHAVEAIS